MIPRPITSEWLFGGNVVKSGYCHLNGGTWWAVSHTLVDKETGEPLGLDVSDTGYKRTYKDRALRGKVLRTWHVGGDQFDDVEAALDVLNAKRDGQCEP